MITNLDAASERFLSDVDRVQRRINEASSQLSSGKSIDQASDAPDQISSLLQLRAELQHNTRVQANLVTADTEATTADDVLADAIDLMDRALVLASEGATATATDDTRSVIAQEVEGLLQSMVSCSQTTVQGRYIFSGDQDDSAAYSLDLTAENGVTQLSNAPSTRRIENPAGGSFSASKTAQEIFDTTNEDGSAASDNVFAALNDLRTALLNNDTDALETTISNIKAASNHLNSMQAFYGTVEGRIQDAEDFASTRDTTLQTAISAKEDSDTVAAAVELTQANTQLQAALEARSNMPESTLFDYLG